MDGSLLQQTFGWPGRAKWIPKLAMEMDFRKGGIISILYAHTTYACTFLCVY